MARLLALLLPVIPLIAGPIPEADAARVCGAPSPDGFGQLYGVCPDDMVCLRSLGDWNPEWKEWAHNFQCTEKLEAHRKLGSKVRDPGICSDSSFTTRNSCKQAGNKWSKDSTTDWPTNFPTYIPSSQPTIYPSQQPSEQPSVFPTSQPSDFPSIFPTSQPTHNPTEPTIAPSSAPSEQPTGVPSFNLKIECANNILSNLSNKPSTQKKKAKKGHKKLVAAADKAKKQKKKTDKKIKQLEKRGKASGKAYQKLLKKAAGYDKIYEDLEDAQFYIDNCLALVG